jgi:hypothetical protein
MTPTCLAAFYFFFGNSNADCFALPSTSSVAVGKTSTGPAPQTTFEGFAGDPRPPGGQKLSGADKHRIRQGRYRILYFIRDDVLIVTVVKVAGRKNVYR